MRIRFLFIFSIFFVFILFIVFLAIYFYTLFSWINIPSSYSALSLSNHGWVYLDYVFELLLFIVFIIVVHVCSNYLLSSYESLSLSFQILGINSCHWSRLRWCRVIDKDLVPEDYFLRERSNERCCTGFLLLLLFPLLILLILIRSSLSVIICKVDFFCEFDTERALLNPRSFWL